MEPFERLLARLRGSTSTAAISRGDRETRVVGGSPLSGGNPGAGGYITVPPTVGNPGGGGYVSLPPSSSGGGSPGSSGYLGGFARTAGFTSAADAFAFGFNPALKAKDQVGGVVTAEEIESSKNSAVVGATLASTGAGDFGIGLPVVPGVNPALVLLGLAGLALVGYSFVK